MAAGASGTTEKQECSSQIGGRVQIPVLPVTSRAATGKQLARLGEPLPKHPPWPGPTAYDVVEVTLQQEVPARNAELKNYHLPQEFGEGQKERDHKPCVLPSSQNLPCWNPSSAE